MSGAKRILVVDDEEKNRKLAGVILASAGYDCDQAGDGEEALAAIARARYDLVLLDVMMPRMDGYATCRAIRSGGIGPGVPVVMVTSLDDRDSRIRGLEAGASDFLTKPVDSTELLLRCGNLLKVKEYGDLLERYNAELEAEVEKKTRELKESYRDTILRLVYVSEYKDEETGGHIRRVGSYCGEFARSLGLSREEIELIELASPMHDIGKVGIPSEILLKRGKLTELEFSLIKTHPEIGARILSGSSSKVIQVSASIALCHHERWDGSGYPRGLKGAEIPLEARIMGLADQYDALRSVRPYKPALGHERTCEIILKGDGRTMPGHFDPELLGLFGRIGGAFEAIYEASEGPEQSGA